MHEHETRPTYVSEHAGVMPGEHAQEQLRWLSDDLSERTIALADASVDVLRGAVQPNGALVAANRYDDSTETAVDYHYMWLRDAAENLQAMYALGMPEAANVRAGLVDWVNNVMLGDDARPGEPKLSHKRHHVLTGAHDKAYYRPQAYSPPEWQPDNNALLAHALANTCPPGPVDQATFQALRSLCNGLCNAWDETTQTFMGNVENQWENHVVQQRHFTHTILAAASGLTRAAQIHHLSTPENRPEVASWMLLGQRLYEIFEAEQPHPHEPADAPYLRLLRQPGHTDENNPLDAGVNLVLADRLRPETPMQVRVRSLTTLHALGELTLQYDDGAVGGLYRNNGDTYDGIFHPDGHEPGAGAWPLLAFSQAIALEQFGEHAEAKELFLDVVQCLDDRYREGTLPCNVIPEQIFPKGDERQGRGVMPLAWSHAMFVRAAKAVGYL